MEDQFEVSVNLIIESARQKQETFTVPQNDWRPTLYVRTTLHTPLHEIPLPLEFATTPPDVRDHLAESMGVYISQVRAWFAAFVTSSWYLKLELGAKLAKMQPQERAAWYEEHVESKGGLKNVPEFREEGLSITAVTYNKAELILIPIIRPKNGPPILTAPADIPRQKITGRFVDAMRRHLRDTPSGLVLPPGVRIN